MPRPRTSLAVLFAASLVVAGCGTAGSDDGSDAAESSSSMAIATTTMVGDVVADIMECAGGTAETLMPVGVDPHDFSASSEQVASMVSAQLVVANGLGLEEGLEDALDGAAADGAVVMEVAPLVDPIEFAGDGHAHEDDQEHSEDEHSESKDEADGEEHSHEEAEEHSDEDHAHDYGSMDPHFWHDAGRMAEAAEMIGSELAAVTGDDAYATCGAEVHDAITQADEQVRDILTAVPADQRVLVTDHDALGYFADAYDFDVAGVVIPGGATLAEPSSKELSALVETIDTEGVPAIFSNNANPTDLVPAVAAEAGTEVEVVELYIGSLGPEGSGADTYVGMVTTNAERIAAALS
jgi:zinc/manganese transport system substrate-binding protein